MICGAPLGAGVVADSRGPAADGTHGHASNGHAVLSTEERLLVDALEMIDAGDLDGALVRVQGLVNRRGDFELAKLVRADLLAAKADPLEAFGDPGGTGGTDLAALREEVMARLRHPLSSASRLGLPDSLVGISGRQRQVLVVDIAAARLYLFENIDGEPRLTADYYVSTGKNGSGKERQNDQRTPVGVYFITGRIDAANLPDFYGAGALPVDYPNPWDRRLGRTGYGIWIHGSPAGTDTRAPYASDGCVALSNADLTALWEQLDWESTPVVIAEQVSWWPRVTLAARRTLLAERIEQWRSDWQSTDPKRYARNYSSEFASEGRDRESWLRLRRRASAREHEVEIATRDLSLLGYPGDHRVVVATFVQRYRSAQHRLRLRKQQYWRLEDDGIWRIVYEGVIRLRKEHVKGIPIWARSKLY